jgi:hypothetical protein
LYRAGVVKILAILVILDVTLRSPSIIGDLRMLTTNG